MATQTSNIPTAAAYPMINFGGTNSTGRGGLATDGVTRYMYVSKFQFFASGTY